MSIDLDDYRRAVLDQLADLPGHELRRARQTIDDWLAEREGDDLPPAGECADELRSSLRADRQTAPPGQRILRWGRRRRIAVTAGVVAAVLAATLTWWLRLDANVHAYSGRVWSESLPHATVGTTPFGSGETYFGCERGELEVSIGFNADPRAVLKDVRLSLLDDPWNSASVRRTTATARAEVGGDPLPVPINDFRPARMNQVQLVYQLDHCPVSMQGGGTVVRHATFVYELLGRVHRDRVELVAPVALTGCRVTKATLKC